MILTPKNWKSFQHYTDRKPAWIKLHRDLLNDYDYWCLPVASRALAPCLWLLASEYKDGKIDISLDGLAFKFRMTRGEVADALAPLIEKGFFDASEPLADCKQDAIPEKRRDREEKEENTARAVPSKYAFEDGIIRLSHKDFDTWQKAFSNLDLPAELLSLSEWASEQGAKWFHAVKGALAKRNREVKAAREKQQEQPFKWNGIEGVL
jgi:hypothetical protein